MLTDEMVADGWRVHDGGPCPVDAWQPVEVLLRSGRTAKHPDSRFLEWEATDFDDLRHSSDIIAYRLETPDAQ